MIAIYNGLCEVKLDEQAMADFYQNKNKDNAFGLVKNQYLLVKDESENVVDKYRWDGEKLVSISFKRIRTQMLGEVKPKNINQQCFCDLLDNDSIKVKVVVGKAGTGKSFLTTNWVAQKLNDGTFERLILLRNNIQTRGVREIGFRKGGTDEKLDGFVSFMKDIITPENFDQLKYENRLETPYLGEIRGRNFSKCCVYVSEAQDLDIQMLQTIVSRVGNLSVLILDGDLNQCDSKYFDGEANGLKAICRSLAGNPLFGVVELTKCERSEVAALAELIK